MKNYKQEALIFKAFCDESRLKIIDLLGNEEICACVLLENLTISQSTLSHHMKILVDSEIVTCRKEGKRTMYHISEQGVIKADNLFKNILNKLK